MIEHAERLWKLFAQTEPERRHWIIAYLVVPGATLVYIVLLGTSLGPAVALEDSISVIPIRSVVTPEEQVSEGWGLVILVEPSGADVAVPLKDATVDTFYSSLDQGKQRLNSEQITVSKDGFKIRFPLLGVSGRNAFVVQGEPTGEVLLPGKSIPLTAVLLPSRQAAGLVLSVVLASVFGLGLAMSLLPLEVAPGKYGS